MAKRISYVQRGQPITADFMNQMIDIINAAITITAGSGLTITEGPGGITFSISQEIEEYEGRLTEELTRGGEAECELLIYSESEDTFVETGRTVKVKDRPRIPTGKKLPTDKNISLGRRGGGKWILNGFDCNDLVNG